MPDVFDLKLVFQLIMFKLLLKKLTFASQVLPGLAIRI